ncbi:MAG: xanthine dehydrogenase family protein subunit M [Deltaproteobacteria bacterium]|nr:xanthine dehydrogenase family protein subunit M [Deltaproteobacteria bacterium]
MIKDFERFAPKTLKEALVLLAKYGDDCKVICGGQSLLILMRQGLVSPKYIVDIKGISELSYIKDGKDGVKIGATTTHRAIEKSPVIKKKYPVLAEMETRLASIQTRNWGTIGGNVCHGDPAGDPVPVLMALNATLTVAGAKGTRSMPVDKFCLDYFEVDLRDGELLTEITIPAPLPRTGTVYTKFNVIESDLATVSVAASVTLGAGDGVCQDVRIALGAVAPTAIRARKAEKVLKGKKITDALLKEAGEVAATETEPISDIYASEEYRLELVKVLVPRMTKEALARAKKA